MKSVWGETWEWRVFVAVIALTLSFLLGVITRMLLTGREFGSAVEALATLVGLGVAGLLAGVQIAVGREAGRQASEASEALNAATNRHAAELAVATRRYADVMDAGARLYAAAEELGHAVIRRPHDYINEQSDQYLPADGKPIGTGVEKRWAFSADAIQVLNRGGGAINDLASRLVLASSQWSFAGGDEAIEKMGNELRNAARSCMQEQSRLLSPIVLRNRAQKNGAELFPILHDEQRKLHGRMYVVGQKNLFDAINDEVRASRAALEALS